VVDDLERTTSLSEPPPAVEPLPLSRAARTAGTRGSRWLLGLGFGGLLVVPIVGTVYLSVADFGPTEAAAVGSSTAGGRLRAPVGPGSVTDDDDATEPEDPRARPGTRESAALGRREAKPRTDATSICCTKLRELGKGASLESRASYLAAATACDAAPNEERAFKQVQSVLGGSRVEIPDECTQD
jgi:hypothetical protein